MAHKEVRVEVQYNLNDPDMVFLRQVFGPSIKPHDMIRAMIRQGLTLERAKQNQFEKLNKEQKECLNPRSKIRLKT